MNFISICGDFQDKKVFELIVLQYLLPGILNKQKLIL
ncbi:unnamed protein product, partial [marine sediment metagenome]